ncbi:hypothetical protein CBER1_00586 [Cercospora berteroae]|uniref:Uncharacterized protein n=1 Tax=Cercospora berteroae TaxID=357750 RepID=A0A2S6CB83_9PEZI|nr:hypothetical protein CBER1_00586 [Cercospora berteroae]
MASQITIDLSNIGDKVVAAIHESMEKVVEAKVAAALGAVKIDKNPEPELDIAGMHTQIIINAKYLFQLLAERFRHSIPEFDVVTYGVGTTVSAYVVYMDQRTVRVLIGGPDAPGEAKALHKLLAMTSEMMQKNWVQPSMPDGYDWRLVNEVGNSFYYTTKR